ncbi:hypothetical protein GQ43DRAFT_282689 [Delitschia confertaspora ATCC 74209]|uniref:Uncharacterized protein n=1 Tax=Delitschia confertaspora ATCC 74209 TaxID=1513339 RepID=A0A9P4JRR3_9PLEO|nr:hypothetical protein GQ43DRAFT_282689 [Delitschia confertaspora ATCC 74209]
MAPNEIRMSDHRVSRDVIFPPFDSKAFYTLHNTLSPHKTISSGLNRSTNGTINTTTEETYSSSENWQLFYQSGRYFLHNYDYGPEFQLGVTKDSWTVPRLIPRSGALGQQWNIERWDDGEEEGKGGSVWRLTNALVGEQQFLGLSEPNTCPALLPHPSNPETQSPIQWSCARGTGDSRKSGGGADRGDILLRTFCFRGADVGNSGGSRVERRVCEVGGRARESKWSFGARESGDDGGARQERGGGGGMTVSYK